VLRELGASPVTGPTLKRGAHGCRPFVALARGEPSVDLAEDSLEAKPPFGGSLGPVITRPRGQGFAPGRDEARGAREWPERGLLRRGRQRRVLAVRQNVGQALARGRLLLTGGDGEDDRPQVRRRGLLTSGEERCR
jgi:hypothetical protein